MAKAQTLFSAQDEQEIVTAIQEAERQTSGEIRVHVEASCGAKETTQRAIEVFQMLQMHETEARNGVLFYLAHEDKKFSIYGDQGINQAVEANFWEDIRDLMQSAFKQGDFKKGLIDGISASGQALKKYFPYQSDDKNELDDSISKA